MDSFKHSNHVIRKERKQMKFSLINIFKEDNGKVTGNWIQNHVGTLDSATQLARETEKVNHNRIQVAVVDELSTPVPILGFFKDLIRLDQ